MPKSRPFLGPTLMLARPINTFSKIVGLQQLKSISRVSQ